LKNYTLYETIKSSKKQTIIIQADNVFNKVDWY